MSSCDDQAYLRYLQATFPHHADVVHRFAEQHGRLLTPSSEREAPPEAAEFVNLNDPTMRPEPRPDLVTTLTGYSHPPIAPERCSPPAPPLPPLPPKAAMFHTGAPLEGAELMAAVIARRHELGLTQAAFAERLGISLRTYQEWEQGRRRPSGPAESMLRWQL